MRTSSADLALLQKSDDKRKASISLYLSGKYLEYVQDAETACGTWVAVRNVFLTLTLLNRLNARGEFYSLEMGAEKRTISYFIGAKQLCTDSKAMDAVTSDQELTMTVLCELPKLFEHLIVSIDAVADVEKATFEFVGSRPIREERRVPKQYKPAD